MKKWYLIESGDPTKWYTKNDELSDDPNDAFGFRTLVDATKKAKALNLVVHVMSDSEMETLRKSGDVRVDL